MIRSTLTLIAAALLSVALTGCIIHASVVHPIPPASSDAPDDAAAVLQTRLAAAEQITSFPERDKALAIIARDAAQDGFAALARRALEKITSFPDRDAAALAAVRSLSKAGRRPEAIEIARMITSFVERDRALNELAQ